MTGPRHAGGAMEEAATRHSRTPIGPLFLEGLVALWGETEGDERIRIAVLDGPVDAGHPCLAGARLSSLGPQEVQGAGRGQAAEHGTHIASILFGRHEEGCVWGVAPGCSGLIAPLFEDDGAGIVRPASQLALAAAIRDAVEAGAQVINVSGGQLQDPRRAHPELKDAVRLCHAREVLLVAAAGNDGCECLHVPGAL